LVLGVLLDTFFVGLQYPLPFLELPQLSPVLVFFHSSLSQRLRSLPFFPFLGFPFALRHFATCWLALALGHTLTLAFTFLAQSSSFFFAVIATFSFHG
jgi:hypothetical protein